MKAPMAQIFHTKMFIIASAVPFFFGATVHSKSLEELEDIFKTCQTEGKVTSPAPKVLDFERLSGGKSQTKSCVYDAVCNNARRGIKDYRHALVCPFDAKKGCEKLVDCIPNIKSRPELGFAPAATIKQKTDCTDRFENQFIFGVHKENAEDYTPVCLKELTCKQGNGIEVSHPLVFCRATGKKAKGLLNGVEEDLDECPNPDQCLKEPYKMDVPSEPEYMDPAYQRKLAAKDEAEEKLLAEKRLQSERARIRETLPRGSGAGGVSSATPSGHFRGKK